MTALIQRDPVLVKLEAARQYLAEATDLAEVKNIADVAASAEVYAKRQQLGEEAIGFAHRVKIDALTRLGELLRDMPKAPGTAGLGRPQLGGTRQEPPKDIPNMGEVFGMERKAANKMASVAQQLAALPEDVREEVASREKSLTQVRREVKAQTIAERGPAEWPEGKYRVIYADPPWSYGNTQPDYHTEQRDHYGTMPLADICALPVRALALDDAVLFLWATSPILEEAFDVIRAWGFAYKSSFVWDKVKHNMGHYNSVRHELLLIATRGSCPPDVQQLFDSVQSVERTRHSEKPEVFREIIDTIYPHGPRVELFARQRVGKWEGFGNELSAA